ncbi:IS30 family transposase [Sphingobium yanoikuyae]
MNQASRKTLTFDNGAEFARHHRLNSQLGIATYFCDTHSPWQKGGVENAIGRLRRSLPRKTNIAFLSKNSIDAIVKAYNNTPRKCLGFKTRPKSSILNRCTSNVNPHPDFRQDDAHEDWPVFGQMRPSSPRP